MFWLFFATYSLINFSTIPLAVIVVQRHASIGDIIMAFPYTYKIKEKEVETVTSKLENIFSGC